MNYRYFIILSFYLFSTGCAYNIKSTIEKSENFANEGKKGVQQPIFYLDPQINIFHLSDEGLSNGYFLKQRISNAVNEETKRSAGRQKINIIQSDKLNINNLTPAQKDLFFSLRRRIIATNNVQENPLNKIIRKSSNPFVQQVFTVEPFIGFEYSPLSEILGTDLVGLIGVLSINLDTKDEKTKQNIIRNYGFKNNSYVEYHFIVNITTGKLIYREFRWINSKISPVYLFTSVYDSFYLLNKNLKQ